MSHWHDIVWGITLIILVLLCRLEYSRKNRAWRWARILAVTFALASLAGLLLPFSYQRRIHSAGDGTEGILVTEGTDPDSLRTFLHDKPTSTVWTWPEEAGSPFASDSTASIGNLGRLHLFGYGLTNDQWSALRSLSGLSRPTIIFHRPAGAGGLRSIDWKRELVAGEKLPVQGRFEKDRTGRPILVKLVGMGRTLDSALAGPDFSLATIPAQTGRALYEWMAISGSDTLEREKIPFEVLPAKKLSILILAATPDFENTFFMNWLTRNGHRVARRTSVSREKYDQAFSNMPQQGLAPLTSSLLQSFDLVLADAAALSSLGFSERSVLQRAVQESGIGLIIKSDSLFLKEWPGMETISRDSLSRPNVTVLRLGQGKRMYTVLNNTYAQALSGGEKQYAAYWSGLLRRMARETGAQDSWRASPLLPLVDQPVRIELRSAGEELPEARLSVEKDAATRTVYLAQDWRLPFYWQGNYWPEVEGWQFIQRPAGDKQCWYVWPRDHWKNLRRREREEITRQAIVNRAANPGGPGAEPAGSADPIVQQTVPIPKAWYYAVFLLCMIFLWLERKMDWMSGRILR